MTYAPNQSKFLAAANRMPEIANDIVPRISMMTMKVVSSTGSMVCGLAVVCALYSVCVRVAFAQIGEVAMLTVRASSLAYVSTM